MQPRKAVKAAAEIIAISLRTAPKSAGVDDIAYTILNAAQKGRVSLEIKRIARALKAGKSPRVQKAIELDWHSDADAVDKSDCLILVGVKGRKALGLDCSGCGLRNCQDFSRSISPQNIFMAGPFCIFKLWDLGIAISSAAKSASDLNIDSRIMYRAGLAGYRLGLLKGYSPLLGLPLSATGKNIYFDRKDKIQARELWQAINSKKDR